MYLLLFHLLKMLLSLTQPVCSPRPQPCWAELWVPVLWFQICEMAHQREGKKLADHEKEWQRDPIAQFQRGSFVLFFSRVWQPSLSLCSSAQSTETVLTNMSDSVSWRWWNAVKRGSCWFYIITTFKLCISLSLFVKEDSTLDAAVDILRTFVKWKITPPRRQLKGSTT